MGGDRPRPLEGNRRRPAILYIADRAVAEMKAHAAADYPNECCGLLVGHWDGPEGKTVERAERARNLETERPYDRFELDLRDFLRVDKQARADGLEIVGFYHSHPDYSAEPSPIDAERAWPAYSYVIVSVRRGEATALRSWVFDESARTFTEEAVTRTGG